MGHGDVELGRGQRPTRVLSGQNKGLGKCSLQHLPHIQPHTVAEKRKLVYQRNIDSSEGIFKDFNQLGCFGTRNRNDLLYSLTVKGNTPNSRELGPIPPTTLDVLRVV